MNWQYKVNFKDGDIHYIENSCCRQRAYDNLMLIWQTETKYIFEFSYRIITYTRHLYQCWCVGRHVVLKCLNIVLCRHNMCIIRWRLNANRADRWITWVTVDV